MGRCHHLPYLVTHSKLPSEENQDLFQMSRKPIAIMVVDKAEKSCGENHALSTSVVGGGSIILSRWQNICSPKNETVDSCSSLRRDISQSEFNVSNDENKSAMPCNDFIAYAVCPKAQCPHRRSLQLWSIHE